MTRLHEFLLESPEEERGFLDVMVRQAEVVNTVLSMWDMVRFPCVVQYMIDICLACK